MDSFVTTYGKDYRWPYVRTMSVRAEEPYLTTLPHRERQKLTIPGCVCEPKVQPKVLGPDKFGKTWCKQGPSPPLLVPVVYYTEQSPEQRDTVRFDQPNVYLKQLYEKYPYLYKIIQGSPPDELVRRIQNARHITTYQADYDHKGDGTSEDYDNLVAHGFELSDPCHKRTLIIEPSQGRYVRPKLITKSFDYRALKQEREAREAQELSQGQNADIGKPGVSEYMDSISKLGGVIIRDKMLYKKKK